MSTAIVIGIVAVASCAGGLLLAGMLCVAKMADRDAENAVLRRERDRARADATTWRQRYRNATRITPERKKGKRAKSYGYFTTEAALDRHLLGESGKRCEALEEALRYWLPDETKIPEGHEEAWSAHSALLTPERRGH